MCTLRDLFVYYAQATADLLARLEPMVRAHEVRIAQPLTATEQRELVRLLQKVANGAVRS